MNSASLRTALIAAVIVAIGAFALFSIGGATAQQACIQPLAGNGTVNGTWDNTCLSENTPLGDYSFPTGTRYARFYTFTLSETSTVTVELQSSADTYMYLMQGKGKTGAILRYNDDHADETDCAASPNLSTDSCITASLAAGDYTIEATTYEIETTGNFTFTVSGLPAASTPTITPTSGAGDAPTVTPTHTPTATATSVSGQAPPTITPTPTATPTQTSVPSNVLNRLTALETRAATQQGLIATMESKITALDGRIAALESSASNPTPTPTPTVTPTPTATPTGTVRVHTLRELAAIEDNWNYSDPDIRIRVRAYVHRVYNDIGDLTLWIRDAGYREYCKFDEAHRSAVTALTEGQIVTVDGTFNGFWLRDCALTTTDLRVTPVPTPTPSATPSRTYTLRELNGLGDNWDYDDPDIRVRVRAYVDFVNSDTGDLTLWMRDAGYSEYCYFDEAYRSAVTALNEGQQATVDGTFNGLWLRDCELVSVSGQGTGNAAKALSETEIEELREQQEEDLANFEMRKSRRR